MPTNDELLRQMQSDALDELFTYHAPQGDEAERYVRIRAAAKTFAHILLVNCPAGPDRARAVVAIREAVMFANASIATRNAADRFLDAEYRLVHDLVLLETLTASAGTEDAVNVALMPIEGGAE